MSAAKERFEEVFKVGGKSNSLGRTNEVIERVLHDASLLEQVYDCVFSEDAWVRMRAIDAIEKICRQHPEWLSLYIDRFQKELHGSMQPSIQWHLAQIYQQVELTDKQRAHAIEWLEKRLSATEADWIVAANAMDALAYFVRKGDVSRNKLVDLLDIQLHHASRTVMKRAARLLDEFSQLSQ